MPLRARRHLVRGAAMTVSALLAAVVLPVNAASAAPAAGNAARPAAGGAGQDEGRRALAEAKRSGERVEVAGERSERTT
ncbi:hypothetical protein ABZ070_33305, partial [Streptomyces sp. NPDC006283]|uniref:hypothetical protein n=1 Tax=Streptomyces sp. NPDC006283 TaxID=3156741 RepID=UPI00339E607A